MGRDFHWLEVAKGVASRTEPPCNLVRTNTPIEGAPHNFPLGSGLNFECLRGRWCVELVHVPITECIKRGFVQHASWSVNGRQGRRNLWQIQPRDVCSLPVEILCGGRGGLDHYRCVLCRACLPVCTGGWVERHCSKVQGGGATTGTML